MVLRANLQNGVWRQAFQEHAPLDFGLDDIPIDLVAEVGMGREHCITVPGFAPSHNSNLRERCTLVQPRLGQLYGTIGIGGSAARHTVAVDIGRHGHLPGRRDAGATMPRAILTCRARNSRAVRETMER